MVVSNLEFIVSTEVDRRIRVAIVSLCERRCWFRPLLFWQGNFRREIAVAEDETGYVGISMEGKTFNRLDVNIGISGELVVLILGLSLEFSHRTCIHIATCIFAKLIYSIQVTVCIAYGQVWASLP